MSKVACAVEKAGGHAISAIDTVRCILGVDLKSRKPYLPTYGGYSGSPIRPLGLASVATIAQSTKLPVCGIGGISSYEHVLEYMMLGATAVQVGTAVMLDGFSHIGKMTEDLEKWMDENGVTELPQIRGAALTEIKSFDEIQVEPKVSHFKSECIHASCEKCVKACVYGAMEKTGGRTSVSTEKCKGCGLCCDICPEGRIELIWP
jgi:Pyruvate/2-oxoacid:ferredoxin oxidoreductase delta subunit